MEFQDQFEESFVMAACAEMAGTPRIRRWARWFILTPDQEVPGGSATEEEVRAAVDALRALQGRREALLGRYPALTQEEALDAAQSESGLPGYIAADWWFDLMNPYSVTLEESIEQGESLVTG